MSIHKTALLNFLKEHEHDLLDMRFTFLDFEYYYIKADEDEEENGNPTVMAAEVGLETFTIRRGFDRQRNGSFTDFIPTTTNCTGLLATLRMHCNQNNKIQFDHEFKFSEKQWRNLYKRICKTFPTDGKDSKLLLFCRDPDLTLECLKQIAKKANYESHFENTARHAVTSWVNLVQAVMEFCRDRYRDTLEIMPINRINRQYWDPSFENFSMNRCDFHLDGNGHDSKYCAKESALKMGYTFWAIVQNHLFDVLPAMQEYTRATFSRPGHHYPSTDFIVHHNVDLDANARYYEEDSSDSDDTVVEARYRYGSSAREPDHSEYSASSTSRSRDNETEASNEDNTTESAANNNCSVSEVSELRAADDNRRGTRTNRNNRDVSTIGSEAGDRESVGTDLPARNRRNLGDMARRGRGGMRRSSNRPRE